MNDETRLPEAPATTNTTESTTDPTYGPTYDPAPAPRTWRDRVPRGRKALAAGVVVAGLAMAGAGFGAGYAVGDDGSTTTGITNGFDGHGFPGDRHGPMDGQMPGGTPQDGSGATGQAPDFDGDGQPDTDPGSGADSGSTSGSDSSSTGSSSADTTTPQS